MSNKTWKVGWDTHSTLFYGVLVLQRFHAYKLLRTLTDSYATEIRFQISSTGISTFYSTISYINCK